MTINLDTSTNLRTSISIQRRNSFTVCSWTADPWRWFPTTTDALEGIFNTFVQVEAGIWSSSANNQLRELVAVMPGAAAAGRKSVVESNALSSPPFAINSGTTSSIRERSRFQASLVLNLFFACVVYATDSSARTDLYTQLSSSTVIPSFLGELLKKVREGRADNIYVRTFISDAVGKKMVLQNPLLKNTMMDPEFLTTKSGITSFLSICQYLHNSEGNYIKMVQATEAHRLPISSGNTITFTALTLQSGIDDSAEAVLNATVGLSNGHSFGTTINHVHIIDIVWFGAILDDVTCAVNTAIFTNGSLFETSATTRTFIELLVYRLAGNVTNNNRADEPSPPEGFDPAPTPADERRERENTRRDRNAQGGRGRGRDSRNSFNNESYAFIKQTVTSIIRTLLADRAFRSSFI